MPTLIEQKRMSTPVLRRAASKGPATAIGEVREAEGEVVATKEDRKPRRTVVRRWMAAAMILGTALLTVGFVANAIEVNALLGSITSVEGERDAVRRENERLRAELLRLMSVEQVTTRATELGMIQPDAPPVALELSGSASKEKEEKKRTE